MCPSAGSLHLPCTAATGLTFHGANSTKGKHKHSKGTSRAQEVLWSMNVEGPAEPLPAPLGKKFPFQAQHPIPSHPMPFHPIPSH